MKLVCLPRDPNPYQGLLYGELGRRGVEVAYGSALTPSHTLNLLLLPLELLARRMGGATTLHLHWVFGFRLAGAGRMPVMRRVSEAWFGVVLAVARLLGMHVVWTAHNVLPHEPVFADDARARRRLVRASHLVLVHGATTLDELDAIGATPQRAVLVPHGPFGPAVDATTLRRPGDGRGARTVLFLGRIEPYKGVEELLHAAALLPAEAAIRIVVAGRCEDGALRDRVLELARAAGDRVELRLGHVPEADVSELMAAADVVALPLRRATTSGSALLALGHGRPLVVSPLPVFAGLPDATLTRYDGSVAGLADALTRACERSEAELAAAGAAALQHAAQSSWADSAERTLGALDGLARPSRRERLRSLRGDAFYRGSLHLLLNSVSLASFGFLFWALAARLYPSSAVGSFAAITSAVTLLCAVAALGLPNTVTRHLATTEHPRELLSAMLIGVACAGGAICLGVLLLLGPSLPDALHVPGDAGGRALLVTLTITAAAGNLVDAGLIALRRTRAVLGKNVAASAIKVAALPCAAGLGVTGLVAAYTAGSTAALLAGTWTLWRRLERTPRVARLAVLRRYAGFSGGSYAGLVLGILPMALIPILVLSRLGARPAAWSSVAFLCVGFLSFIPSTAAQVLFAEASRGEQPIATHAGKAGRSVFGLLIPGVAALWLAAPVILQAFGAEYREGATGCLRMLALGSLFTGGTYLVDGILAATDRVRTYIAINAANAALVLAAVWFALPHGLTATAEAWVGAQAASLALGLVLLLHGTRAASAPAPASGPEATGQPSVVHGAPRLRFLDGLRGVAATYVVISHCWDTALPHATGPDTGLRRATAFLGFGRYAVALFIVVSGFSLGLAAWHNGLRWPDGPAGFLRRRARRIVPPYLAAVAVCSLIGAIILAHPRGTLWDGAIPIRPWGVVVHGALLQDVVWRGPAGSTAFWSIAIEVHIYLFFVVFLIALRRHARAWLWAVAAFAALTVFAVTGHSAVAHEIGGMTPSLYAVFVLGVMAARSATAGVAFDLRRWQRGMLVLFVAGVVIEATCVGHLQALGPLNDLWLGPLLAAGVARLALGGLPRSGRLLRSRPAAWLGECSYSLYLIHPVVLEIVWRVAVRPIAATGFVALAAELVLGTLASVVVARGFYHLVEKRFATAPKARRDRAPRPDAALA